MTSQSKQTIVFAVNRETGDHQIISNPDNIEILAAKFFSYFVGIVGSYPGKMPQAIWQVVDVYDTCLLPSLWKLYEISADADTWKTIDEDRLFVINGLTDQSENF